MSALIVHTVTGRTMADLRAARESAVGDLVELRLDGVADIDVAGALQGRTRPVIVTCRAAWEGGAFDGDEATRLGILSQAIALGAEYVDVEWKADRRTLPVNPQTTTVLSHHDFTCTPGDLEDRIRTMASENPGILKIAVTARRLRDCVNLREASRLDQARVVIAMGAAGQLTRFCPRLFGSRWTYGGAAAPGQVPASDLVGLYRVHRQSDATALYAVAGAPLAHSASPAMHNAAFAAMDLDAVYVPLETDSATELLEVAETFGIAGASVTAPLKTGAFALVKRHDDLAKQTGAINTVRHDDAIWEGRNFDVAGFLAPLEGRHEELRGRRCVVLGSGGAARTALWALRSKGARVEVAARNAERAQALALEFGANQSSWPPVPGWDLLVNTTPVGTWPDVDAMPLGPEAIHGRMVYDLIYNPEETALLRTATRHGAETIGGLEMLVGQACLQFAWWTGRTPPRDVMFDAARRFLTGRQGQL